MYKNEGDVEFDLFKLIQLDGFYQKVGFEPYSYKIGGTKKKTYEIVDIVKDISLVSNGKNDKIKIYEKLKNMDLTILKL